MSETIVRVTLGPEQHFEHKYLFTGSFEVVCPRCEKLSTIVGATLGLELSCGCRWHPPSEHRYRDPEAWLKYEGEQVVWVPDKTQEVTQEEPESAGTDRENSAMQEAGA